MYRVVIIAIAAFSFVLSGCGGPFGACTAVGCLYQGPTVEFSDANGDPVESFSGSATLSFDGGSSRTVDFVCDPPIEGGQSGYSCGSENGVWASTGGVYFPLGQGEAEGLSMQVSAQSSDGELQGSKTVEPDWETSRPNGRGCDPVCHEATVSIVLE